MRALLPLLLLAACAEPPPADEPDPPAAVKPDAEPPVDTDRPDTDPPDPCLSEPTVVQLGQVDRPGSWENRGFTPFSPGQLIRPVRSADIPLVWHFPWSAQVSNAPEMLRISANLTDVATGVPLLNDREPAEHNIAAIRAVLGQPWTCNGGIPETDTWLDPRGLDDDDTVPSWQELCGRTVRLDVSLRTADRDNIAATNIQLVLGPPESEGETCP